VPSYGRRFIWQSVGTPIHAGLAGLRPRRRIRWVQSTRRGAGRRIVLPVVEEGAISLMVQRFHRVSYCGGRMSHKSPHPKWRIRRVNVTCDVCGRGQESDWIWVGDGMHFRPGEGIRLTGDYCSVGCLQAAIDRLHVDPESDKAAKPKRKRHGRVHAKRKNRDD